MRSRITPIVALGALALLTLLSSSAVAQAPLLTGYGGPAGFGGELTGLLTGQPRPGDDASEGPLDLSAAFPNGINYFGTTYTSAYVNINGNLTFNGPVEAFSPVAFPVADQPMIAAWWADVDLRGIGIGADNSVYFAVDAGNREVVITWNTVGYYNSKTNKLNSFQMILKDRSVDFEPGDFDVEFRYNRCEWTTGDATGGANGLGGTPAQVGFDAGDTVNFYDLDISRTARVLEVCTTSNVTIPGVWRFFVRGGQITLCGNFQVDAGEMCDDGNLNNVDGCNRY